MKDRIISIETMSRKPSGEFVMNTVIVLRDKAGGKNQHTQRK